MPTASFGQWLKRRRRALDMTQEELAQRVGCAEVTIYKIEADERRPSKQIARLLAQQLAIPPPDGDIFVKFARSGSAAAPTVMPWGTSFHPPTNLPPSPTPLIGREQDIANVRGQLLRDDTQLLTLVGPPGIGKTRLSLAVADDVLDEFPDGVFVIWLVPISDPDLVPQTIVRTLGIQEVGPQTSLERLTIHLRDKQMLLVLDNFEQILAAAPQVAELLEVCPCVKMLVTSRAPLRIRRERQFPVPALALPDLNRFPEVETLPDFAAVALFVERAQTVKPDFTLTHENALAVAAVCSRLDGLPLAIELISARVKLLPPAALLERLHGWLLLASDGLRDLEPRHRTLSAAIGWSYDLLDIQLKTLFMRLGVFASGCTLEAIEGVCASGVGGQRVSNRTMSAPLQTATLDGLSSLVEKCLVVQKNGLRGEPRFSMLETIREYALERLIESGDEPDLRRQHATYFLAWAEAAKRDAHDRIEQEYDNLRAALDWYWSNDLKMGMALVLAMADYWHMRGHAIEGRFWAEKYLEAQSCEDAVSPDIQREVLSRAALFAYYQDDLESVYQHKDALLALGTKWQDKAATAFALFWLGVDALRQQDFGRAYAMFEESLSLSRQVNVLWHHTASTLLMLGLVAEAQKDYERAWIFDAESLATYRQLGEPWGEALILGNSAAIRMEQGKYQEAYNLVCQALHINCQLGCKRNIAGLLDQLACLANLEQGDHQRAARLMGAAEALRDSISAPVEPLNRRRHDEIMARVRASLDESAFAAAWAEGRLMTLEQAVEDALSD